jgi:hypothetical protein
MVVLAWELPRAEELRRGESTTRGICRSSARGDTAVQPGARASA